MSLISAKEALSRAHCFWPSKTDHAIIHLESAGECAAARVIGEHLIGAGIASQLILSESDSSPWSATFIPNGRVKRHPRNMAVDELKSQGFAEK